MRNLLIGAAALVAALVLFAVLRPDDDDAATTAGTTTLSTTGTQTTAEPGPPPPPPPPSPPPPARVSVTVSGGLPVGGVRRVTVARGRRVVLRVTSDVADHVHLHGYDVTRDVAPGRPAEIAFRATIPGTVEAELEGRRVQIATITAQP